MSDDTKLLAAIVTIELYDRIKEAAKKDDRNVSQFVRLALNEKLASLDSLEDEDNEERASA
jgi:hypothetical protein